MSTPAFHSAIVEVAFDESAGDAFVSLSLIQDINGTPSAPQSVFTNQLLAGLTPFDFRLGFVGRTGGQTALQQVDNINFSALQIPEPASIAIWSLIGLGLAGFGYYRVRRKK